MKKSNDSTTEQLILEIAENLFLEKGFALTSTIEIARIAGCNQALVHYYFRTKEQLFNEIFGKFANLFVSVFLEKMDDTLSFEENVRKKAEAHYDILKANPKLPFLFFNELNTNPERLMVFKEKTGELPATLLGQMDLALKGEIEKGTIRPMTASDLVLTIFSLNLGLFLAAPVLKVFAGVSETEFQSYVENRKRENVTIILKSLRP